jgi:hypothetical protein
MRREEYLVMRGRNIDEGKGGIPSVGERGISGEGKGGIPSAGEREEYLVRERKEYLARERKEYLVR